MDRGLRCCGQQEGQLQQEHRKRNYSIALSVEDLHAIVRSAD
jgi:hypothetical protein